MRKNRKKKHIFKIITLAISFLALSVGIMGGTRINAAVDNPLLLKRIVGYLPSYKVEAIDTIDYSALTHINLAFANPDENGNIHIDMSDEDICRVVTNAHNKGAKVLISLGGFDGSTSINYVNLTRTNENIIDFSNKIMDFVKKHNLDGVDVDIEGNASDEFWITYDSFVTLLKNTCISNDKVLTTSVGKWYSNKITTDTFNKFDFVMIMVYDYSFKNNAPMYFVYDVLDHFKMRGVSQDKLVIGVPFYGWDERGNGYSYKDIMANDINARLSDNWNGISYNGEATIRAKAELSKEYGGIMIWELGQNTIGEYSLLEVIKNTLKNPNYKDQVEDNNTEDLPGSGDLDKDESPDIPSGKDNVEEPEISKPGEDIDNDKNGEDNKEEVDTGDISMLHNILLSMISLVILLRGFKKYIKVIK